MPTSSNLSKYENSIQDGEPVEFYKFTCNGTDYLYTSRRKDLTINDEIYYGEYIERQELKPGSSNSLVEMTITVSKEDPVAKLYQQVPPETPINLKIMRLHMADMSKVDTIFYGRATQASFEDSKCQLTFVMESWLKKELPNGLYQYTCNNVLYNHNCKVDPSQYQEIVFLDKDEGLNIYSKDFAKHPDGYYENGKMYFNGQVRMIASHKGEVCTLKYPFSLRPRNNVVVLPGCDKTFNTCVKRFGNALNFTGFPYCPPTDAEKNPTGVGTYWVNGNIVFRDTNGYIH